MTIQDARSAIGKPFKYALCAKWDTIREVKDDGTIIGDFIECHCEDARLKQPQPEQLKKKHNEQEKNIQ